MKWTTSLPSLCLVLAALSPLGAQTPWLPHKWEVSLNPSYTFETFDEYHFGQNKEDVPFGDVDHHRFLAGFELGVLEDVALDFTIGYVRTLSSLDESEDNLDDITFGGRYRVVDEFEEDFPFYVPTITLRAGGIAEGSYDPHRLDAPGKRANGFEGSILAGKEIGSTGLRVYGDLGYRIYDRDVPDDFFAGVGVTQKVFSNVSARLAYRHIQSLSGPDVDDPGFVAREFPERKEISETIEVGLGYETDGGRVFEARFGKTLTGRNTASKFIFGVSAFLPF